MSDEPNVQDAPAATPDPQDEPQKTEPQERTFSEKELQTIRSEMGRLIKKQLEESVLPEIQNIRQTPQHQPDPQDFLKDFNTRVSDRFFSGDPMGAFNEMMTVYEKSKNILSENQKTQLTRELTGFQEDEYYKDIYPAAQKEAEKLLQQGYGPKESAEHAFYKAKANHLQGKKKSDVDEHNLDFVEGGRPPQRSARLNPLPPQFKEALERDIADGIVKDEAEFRKALHPSIRKQYGI